MFFDQTFISNLKSRISIADVVSESVRLKPKGKGDFLGLCPFHQEKTPSFTVSESRNFYHCFGCGAHGDAIKFVMEQRGLTYPEAIKDLALRAGVPLPVYSKETVEKQKKIEDSYEVMELAAKWFENNLLQTNAMEARKYLRDRGLKDETIKKFRLGFAPDNRDSLNAYLKKEGADQSLIIANGLVGESETHQIYDRFRGRIMFPIFDSSGKVIAFGGRILDNSKEVAKYLNSPETDLFKKSYVLYGYNFARDKAYKKEQIIVVEGYMDVITMHQAGFDNTVAPLGTAVTEFHLQHLWKICKEPVFCLDGDSAGLRASKKTAENYIALLEPGYSMKFAFMSGGKDPDEVINNGGNVAMSNIINNAVNLADFIWQQNLREANPTTPERKAEFADNVLNITGSIQNPIVKKFYRDDFQKRINEFIYGVRNTNKIIRLPTAKSAKKININQNVNEGLIEKLIQIVLVHPELLYNSQIEEFFLSLEPANKLLENLSAEVIDYARSASSMVSENGFLEYLKSKDLGGYVGFLMKIPRELTDLSGEQEVLSAWRYFISEFHLSISTDELNNLSLRNEADEERFLSLQKLLSELIKERDYNRKIFEDVTDRKTEL